MAALCFSVFSQGPPFSEKARPRQNLFCGHRLMISCQPRAFQTQDCVSACAVHGCSHSSFSCPLSDHLLRLSSPPDFKFCFCFGLAVPACHLPPLLFHRACPVVCQDTGHTTAPQKITTTVTAQSKTQSCVQNQSNPRKQKSLQTPLYVLSLWPDLGDNS